MDFYKRNRKDFTIWYHFFVAGRSSVLRRYSMELIDKNATERALTVAAASGKDKDRRTWAKAICVLHDMPVVSPVAHSRWRYSGVLQECHLAERSILGMAGMPGKLWSFCPNCGKNDGLGGGDHR